MTVACRGCGSERIASNVPVAPGAAGLLGRARARVCADCGLLDVFLDDPMAVYLAHRGTAGPGAAANIQCPSCGSVLAAAEASCEACGWQGGAAEQGTKRPRS